MNLMFNLYVLFRALRWLSWLGYLVYSLAFLADRDSHLDQFGHLVLTTDLTMYGLPTAAVFFGFFEMMTRERAGLARPKLGQLIPEQATGAAQNHFAGR